MSAVCAGTWDFGIVFMSGGLKGMLWGGMFTK